MQSLAKVTVKESVKKSRRYLDNRPVRTEAFDLEMDTSQHVPLDQMKMLNHTF